MKNLTVLALALLAVTTVHAQESRFGVQGTITQPMGDVGNKDWMDSKLGLGVGVHVLVDMGSGFALVPRADYTIYRNDRAVDAFVDQNDKVRILTGGMDFNYYFSGTTRQGFYFLAGAGYASATFDTAYVSGDTSVTATGTKGAPYLQAGLGLQFGPHFGVECRYQTIKFKDVETTFLGVSSQQDVTAPSVQASITVRF
jgi:hypothetical protein